MRNPDEGWKMHANTVVVEKIEKRWKCVIRQAALLDEDEATAFILAVESIDGDPKNVKVLLGVQERIVSVVDIINLFKRVAANTDGIPSNLCDVG
jgi:hypothetical protein